MDLLTKEEAAAFIHVPTNTLSFWIQTGTAPPSAKIGRRRMFRRSDLEAFVDAKFEAESKDGAPEPDRRRSTPDSDGPGVDPGPTATAEPAEGAQVHGDTARLRGV